MQKFASTFSLTSLTLMLLLNSAYSMAQQNVNFWNGNKTESRQQYERNILKAALEASTQAHGDYTLSEDKSALSSDEESAVFRDTNTDLFVTVAGNPKLKHEEKIIVTHPLMKGLLGYRLIIVRHHDLEKFAAIRKQGALKKLSVGIPEGWADADLFRHNGFSVVEGGSFDEIFDLLAAKKFDYVSLGANEIEDVFKNRAEDSGMFNIEPTILLYYPFALVFYIDPEKPELAERLRDGLEAIERNGHAQRLFERATGNLIERLELRSRKVFRLENPMLPPQMREYRSTLLNQSVD